METLENREISAVEFEMNARKYERALLSQALALTKDIDDANDLLQDTLARGYKFKEKYLFQYSFYAWIRRIMTNLFINSYHRKRNTDHRHDPLQEDVALGLSRMQTGNSGYQNLLEEEIHREIDKLENKHRETFLLYINGHKYHEIAERLKIPIGTVKNRIHIARQFLRGRIYMN